MSAFRRQQNIRGHLDRAKVARIPSEGFLPKPRLYPKRYIKGMKKCGIGCTACPYIEEGNKLKINGIE